MESRPHLLYLLIFFLDLEMVESREVKEMAYRARCLKEILLGQVAEFYERWNERLDILTVKHKAEQKKLIGRGIIWSIVLSLTLTLSRPHIHTFTHTRIHTRTLHTQSRSLFNTF